HPALVQQLCAEIIALKNAQPLPQRYLATCADVETAIPEVLQRGSFFFADIQRNQVDDASLQVLRYIAAQGEATPVQHAALNQRFPDQLDHRLGLLTRYELITALDEGYVFQVELIRRWFL